MTGLLSFGGLAAFFRALMEAHLHPLPGAAATPSAAAHEDDDDRIPERELEYFYWGLFPVY